MLASLPVNEPAAKAVSTHGSRHPDRRTTVIYTENFSFIQRIQQRVREDGNLPAIDHGILSSAALDIVESEIPNAAERIIQRALEMIMARHRERR